ncbi:FABP family protein [Nocardioides zeae]|uniref:Peroxynitrite isomerase n=1 Tax=Nocardioides imazamoxiresistens TaxID=3231893 RepID=A0ABU3PWC8_9ACTN|nr:FABP family protein [Nocardioides zeae]MDT9593540.1 FABP family protein [Nocardioides zeae]
MPFELPDNLHPACGPIAWMLGTWRGNGHGNYPSIEPFQFGQELIFTHDGRPFFHYMARSWVVDEQGEKVREGAIETGFLRAKTDGEPGEVELLLAHNTGIVEIWAGNAADGKVEIVTDAIGRVEGAQEVTGGKRLYGNVEGELLYAYDMAAEGHELQSHTWARLQRA